MRLQEPDLVIWYPNENLLYLYKSCLLKFRTRFLLIFKNMIYTNAADFQYDIKWQDTAHWVTPFRHFVLGLKFLSGDQSNILLHVSNELLNTHKITIDSQCYCWYSGSCGIFRRSIEKMTQSCIFYSASLIPYIANCVLCAYHYTWELH